MRRRRQASRNRWQTAVRVLPTLLAVGLLQGTGTALAQGFFEDQTGDTLRVSLRAAYTPSVVPSLAAAKDLIYGTIDRANDGVSDGVYGVYSGFFVPFDGSPNADPSQDVFNSPNENTLGINLEHTWPQSKGSSDGPAQSNMHHLFPTKVNVNSARGSLPFGEVTDATANRWYRGSLSTSSIPSEEIAEFSELLSGQLFEPREDHKGNVARAMFYFYTIYEDEADAADPLFFEQQMNTLRLWHYADPADASEIYRSIVVASFQSDKINPFVEDSTLVDRAYFDSGSALRRTPVDAGRTVVGEPFPNPAAERVTIRIESRLRTIPTLYLFDVRGRRLRAEVTAIAVGTGMEFSLDVHGYPRGIYFAQIRTGHELTTRSFVVESNARR